MKQDGISLTIIRPLKTGNRFGKTHLKHITYHTKITYIINCYIGYYMLTKKHDNAKPKNSVSPVCDRYNKTLIHVFYHCKNRKKYGKLLNP